MELSAKAEDKTPYVLVALQECERMNNLTREIRRSLKELDLGLKVCVATSTTVECTVYFIVINPPCMRSEGYCSCPVCMYVCVYLCVSTHTCRLTHWNHKREIPTDSAQYKDRLKFCRFS